MTRFQILKKKNVEINKISRRSYKNFRDKRAFNCMMKNTLLGVKVRLDTEGKNVEVTAL